MTERMRKVKERVCVYESEKEECESGVKRKRPVKAKVSEE